VITLIKKAGGINAQPILAAVHSPFLIATLAHIKRGKSHLQKCILVNYYGQPVRRLSCQKELVFLVNSLQEMHPGVDIIVAGDFNANTNTLQYLA